MPISRGRRLNWTNSSKKNSVNPGIKNFSFISYNGESAKASLKKINSQIALYWNELNAWVNTFVFLKWWIKQNEITHTWKTYIARSFLLESQQYSPYDSWHEMRPVPSVCSILRLSNWQVKIVSTLQHTSTPYCPFYLLLSSWHCAETNKNYNTNQYRFIKNHRQNLC